MLWHCAGQHVQSATFSVRAGRAFVRIACQAVEDDFDADAETGQNQRGTADTVPLCSLCSSGPLNRGCSPGVYVDDSELRPGVAYMLSPGSTVSFGAC